jgi:hypothetical protein
MIESLRSKNTTAAQLLALAEKLRIPTDQLAVALEAQGPPQP